MAKKHRIFFSNFTRQTTLKELYAFFQGLTQEDIKICVYQSTNPKFQDGFDRYGLLICFSEDDFNFILQKQHYQLNDKTTLHVSPFQKRVYSKRASQNTQQGLRTRGDGESSRHNKIDDDLSDSDLLEGYEPEHGLAPNKAKEPRKPLNQPENEGSVKIDDLKA